MTDAPTVMHRRRALALLATAETEPVEPAWPVLAGSVRERAESGVPVIADALLPN